MVTGGGGKPAAPGTRETKMVVLLAISLGLEIVGAGVLLAAFYIWTHPNRRF